MGFGGYTRAVPFLWQGHRDAVGTQGIGFAQLDRIGHELCDPCEMMEGACVAHYVPRAGDFGKAPLGLSSTFA